MMFPYPGARALCADVPSSQGRIPLCEERRGPREFWFQMTGNGLMARGHISEHTLRTHPG